LHGFSCRAAAPIFLPRAEKKETTMFERFKSALRALRPPSYEELERAYLEQSVSRIDLERREREIERGLFRRGFDH
jgi:hypothetical protein